MIYLVSSCLHYLSTTISVSKMVYSNWHRYTINRSICFIITSTGHLSIVRTSIFNLNIPIKQAIWFTILARNSMIHYQKHEILYQLFSTSPRFTKPYILLFSQAASCTRTYQSCWMCDASLRTHGPKTCYRQLKKKHTLKLSRNLSMRNYDELAPTNLRGHGSYNTGLKSYNRNGT